ncbi:MAG: NAD(P)/FAD-dependent oxidoreductase, partial [Alphaproteobacteria bacterium]|nr:NAD(P)/FAD-dependent oxidoreductase [Alphaproteobacteria bacterium]
MKNIINNVKADVCIIGGGSGGLSVAAGTAQLGLKTILIEQEKMGGDCLNSGCIPSKSLLAAAKRAAAARKDDIKGIKPFAPTINFAAVKDHVNHVIKSIEPNDSVARFTRLGVKVIKAAGYFVGPYQVAAGDQLITARYIVIATGSRPVMPSIPGLDPKKILTNENIFKLREKPRHLIIIGGGPIGMEMAQAHCRLGAQVSVVDLRRVLPRDDQAAAAIVKKQLEKEGVKFYEEATIESVAHATGKNNDSNGKGVTVKIKNYKNEKIIIKGSHLLVATGRKSNTEQLMLGRPRIRISSRGIVVDKHLRTNLKHVFAIGDCAGGPQFTHTAGYHAGIIIRQICFKLPATTNYHALPWVTYTDPELAQVGITDRAVMTAPHKFNVCSWPLADNDRAMTEQDTAGFVKIITDKKGRVLGGTIVGAGAGEMIGIIGLAVSAKLKISQLASMIFPYP